MIPSLTALNMSPPHSPWFGGGSRFLIRAKFLRSSIVNCCLARASSRTISKAVSVHVVAVSAVRRPSGFMNDITLVNKLVDVEKGGRDVVTVTS